jgi:hypothetical protein
VCVHIHGTTHGNNLTADLKGAMTLPNLFLSAVSLPMSLVFIIPIKDAAVSHFLPSAFYKRISCCLMGDISF